MLLSCALYNKNGIKTPNIESCVDRLEKAVKEKFLPAVFVEAIDGDYRLELAHLSVRYILDWFYQTQSIPQRRIIKRV